MKRIGRPDQPVQSAQSAQSVQSVQSASLPAVPGVVDGLITAQTDADGSISLRIQIKMGRLAAESREHVEVVLDPRHCEALVEALRSTGSATPPEPRPFQAIPCSVGINLHSSFGDGELRRRTKAPA